MAMGDILYVKMDGSNVDYVSYEKGNMEGPVKVTNSNWIANFDTNGSTTVMRSGNKVDASEIQRFLRHKFYYPLPFDKVRQGCILTHSKIRRHQDFARQR